MCKGSFPEWRHGFDCSFCWTALFKTIYKPYGVFLELETTSIFPFLHTFLPFFLPGVETIQPFTFWGADCVASLTIPSSVKTIGNNAFWYCANLRSITIPNSVTDIGKRAFAFLYQRYSQNQNNVKVYIDDIDSWLNSGYGKAFRDVRSGVLYVELYVGGERVTDVVIPTSVTDLGENALACIDLNSVTLHKGVERIHQTAFYYNTMKHLYSQCKFAPDIYVMASDGIDIVSNKTSFSYPVKLADIYVPSGKGTTYKNKWSSHEAIIKEADMTVTGNQTATSISEMKTAYSAVTGNAVTYTDLTAAELDESVTLETLKVGDMSANVIYYLPSGSTIAGDNIVKGGVAESVVLTDGETVFVPTEFTAVSLTNTRSLPQSDANAYTLCLPYDYALPEGLKAYTMSGRDADGSIVFTQAEAVVANLPYLVVAGATADNLNASNVTMTATPNEMDDAGKSYCLH